MLNMFFAKKEHKEFIKEIPLMTDEELLIAYHSLSDDVFYNTGNKYTSKELRKVYQELKRRGYANSAGEILDYKLQIRRVA